jgi:hypothetical protein
MNTSSSAFVRAVVITAGIFYAFTGLALLVAPQWFFETIGNFPPFNRHYMGDLGAFLLPVGLGLLAASRDPGRYLALIGAVAGANLIHAINHVYDAVRDAQPLSFWLIDTVPLILLAGAFGLALRSTLSKRTQAGV